MPNVSQQKRKRPIGVWVIAIYSFLWVLGTSLSFYLVNPEAVAMNPAAEAFYNSVTIIDYGGVIFDCLVILFAGICLFRLRKIAFYLFVIYLLHVIPTTVWHIFTNNLLATMNNARFLGVVISWAIVIWACFYSWKLTQRGVLT